MSNVERTHFCKPLNSRVDNRSFWMFGLLRVLFKLLEHLVKVLVSLRAVIYHDYVNDHHALGGLRFLLYLILFLLECYDTLNY